MGDQPDHLKTENDNQQKEWDKARGVIQDYDGRLHELRKYGFSFVTALLTAGSILTQAVASATSSTVPNMVKLAVFIITLMLIVALHLLDKNYRVFQQAAYTRAKVIERKLNLELSETIAARYNHGNIDLNVFFVYLLFIIGIAGLGWAILYPDSYLIMWLIGCSLAALILIIFQTFSLKLQFRNRGLTADWTVSPLEWTDENESIRITLNNMGKDPITFKKDQIAWEIKDKSGSVVFQEKVNENIKIVDNFTWVKTRKEFGVLDKGMYQLKPNDWPVPLPISIIVP